MANIIIRIDDALKKQSERVFDEIGLTMTAAITAFLKQSVRVGGIPFDMRIDPYQAYIERALDEADEEARSTDKRLTREELMSELRARIDRV